MRLEGTLDFEHKRAKRWVSVVAVIVPVVLVVSATTWFIRAFVAPPTAPIPAPMTVQLAINTQPGDVALTSVRPKKPIVISTLPVMETVR